MVHAHCKALESQLEGTQDPAVALSLAVPLLVAQVRILCIRQKSSAILNIFPIHYELVWRG